MTSSSARLAILGGGLIGKRHAEHAKQEAELAAVVDPAEQGKEVARQNNVAHFESIDALLAAEVPDGIIIATPNQLHEQHAIQCIEAGIPILIEKPISDSVASARRIVEAGEKHSVPILVGHHRRHNPLITKAKEAIDQGKLGDIVAAHTTCWFYKPDDYFDVTWRREPGAGPIFINLIHDVDLLRHFCGEVVAVQARKSNTMRGNAVEDTAAILLTFQSGALGTVTVSDTIASPWSWELTAGENSAYEHTSALSTMIGGTLGSLSIPDLGFWTHHPTPSWWNPMSETNLNYDEQDPLALQIRHFCDVISHGTMPLVSGQEGLASLAIIEAIQAAAASGETVSISN